MEARIEWTKTMRRRLSPTEILNPDGTINQDSLKPDKAVAVDEGFLREKKRQLNAKNETTEETDEESR